MEPYNPNKSFIQFRLNPDAIKEELISFIPYNRTLRHIYNNQDGDIRETAKVAMSETPVIGSLLAGEPTDAVKEAFLMGIPVPGTSEMKKLKKEINNNPNREYFNHYGNLYYKDKIRNKDKYVNAADKSSKKDVNEWYDYYEGPNTNTYKYNDYKQVLDDIDASGQIHDKLYNSPYLIGRSRNLKNNKDAIELADQFLKSHNVGNKDVYTYPNGYVVVADPVKKTAEIYTFNGERSFSNNYSWRKAEPFNYNDISSNATKVDNNFRANTALESKLLDAEARQLNADMDVLNVDDRYPYLRSGEDIRKLPQLNNQLYYHH